MRSSASRLSGATCCAACICWNRCATSSLTSRGSCITRCGWRTATSTWTTTCAGCRCPHPAGAENSTQVIGEVASTPLDRSRPLWEFHFAEGLAGGRFALIGKIHHALADGVASVNLLARAMDLRDAPTDERDNDEAGVTPDDHRPAARGRTRPHPPDRRSARTDRRRRQRIHPGASAFPGARRSPRSGGRVRRATDVPQPRGVAARRFATAALRLADVKATAKAPRNHVQRCGLATAAGGLRRAVAALRRHGRPPDHRVGAHRHRQVGSRHRQRDQRPVDFAAGARRRPGRTGPAGRAGHQDRQGGPRNPRPAAVRAADGLSADRDRPGGVPVAGPARRAEQDDERRGVQRARAARARPLRRRPGQRDLLDGRAVSRRPGQHHRVELRRPARHRGAHRRRDLQRPARGDRRPQRGIRRITQRRRAFSGDSRSA